ncbi:hypothetical protein AX14_014385 [Amanita brunnescens Koide BX004]|nr:hypothetical protein AX14_014385 [Amanita brunnescens Koide BX004]
MTEYDYSPEAYDRYLATQRRISHWVDNTELHRAEFRTGNDITPSVPPTVYDDDSSKRRTASHDAPVRPGHRRYYSSNYPGYGHVPHYATPPPLPHYPHPPHNPAGLSLPGPMPMRPVVPPPPQSHRTSAAAYVLGPPPTTPYYQYPYPYAQQAYPYMAPAAQGQPPVLPVPGYTNGTPQNTPYYNPHPSQPLRVPPYPPPANINPLKQSQTGDVGGAGSLAYSYSTPLPFPGQANTPPIYGKLSQSSVEAMQYLPPHILHQRLDEIGRTHERRRARSTGSSYSDERGRSSSSSGSRSSTHSRGRSRTRKHWWNFN